MWPTGRSRPRCCAPTTLGRLPEQIVRDALRTHPEILVGEQVRPNAAFVDPRQFLREHMRVEPAPPGACALTLERLEDVAPARGQVAALALASGVASARIDDVKVSVGEITINALLHGCAPAGLWSYVRDDAFVIHVHDRGRGLADPLVGYVVPALEARGGRGVWLAHQLCDSVEAAADDTGTHIYCGSRSRAPVQRRLSPSDARARSLAAPGSHRIEACRVGPKPEPPPDSLRGEAERAREPRNGRRRRRARRRAL